MGGYLLLLGDKYKLTISMKVKQQLEAHCSVENYTILCLLKSELFLCILSLVLGIAYRS